MTGRPGSYPGVHQSSGQTCPSVLEVTFPIGPEVKVISHPKSSGTEGANPSALGPASFQRSYVKPGIQAAYVCGAAALGVRR